MAEFFVRVGLLLRAILTPWRPTVIWYDGNKWRSETYEAFRQERIPVYSGDAGDLEALVKAAALPSDWPISLHGPYSAIGRPMWKPE